MTTIVSVHSFRGGTGKSNTTANVAAQLALGGASVAVVDTDIQSPGVHVLFGFDEHVQPTLNAYLWGTAAITSAAHDVTEVLAGYGREPRGSLHLVPSSMKPADIARVLRDGYDVGLLNDGFAELNRTLRLDYLFIDTHPGLNEETLLSLTISDAVLLILRPDQQDFQGTAITVDVARRLAVPNLLLVVNKVPGSADTADLAEQLDQAYQVPTAALLPLSEEVVVNASSGLFSLTHPEHPWSAGIRAVAQALR